MTSSGKGPHASSHVPFYSCCNDLYKLQSNTNKDSVYEKHFVCEISLKSGQLIIELFSDCKVDIILHGNFRLMSYKMNNIFAYIPSVTWCTEVTRDNLPA